MMRKSFNLFNKSFFKYASLVIGSSALFKGYEMINNRKVQQFTYPFITNQSKLAQCKTAVSKPQSKLYKLFKETKLPSVFIFHSKQRPFHQSFVNTTFKLFQDLGIHVFTIDEIYDIQNSQFTSIIPNINELNDSAYMPKVLFKNGEHVIQLDPYKLMDVKSEQYFKTEYSRHFVAEKFNSVGDLISLLKKFNKRLEDSVCVMYKEQKEQEQDKRSPAEKIRQSNPLAWNAMSQYNKAMLITHNQQLAKELKLQEGYFYIYYKPSYINGFEDFIYSKADTNVEAFQAVEGMCRDRFKFNQDFKLKKPKQYSNFVKKTKDGQKKYKLVTPQMVKDVIDRGEQAFERTYNTQFLMETTWDQQHIRRSTFKPIVLVYIKDDLAEFLVPKLKNLMQKFAGQFEFYFTSEEQKAQQYFPVQDLLGIPYLMIIDNSKRVLVQGNQHMMEKYYPSGSKIDFNQEYDLKTGEPVQKKKTQSQEVSSNDNKSANYLKTIPKQILDDPLLSESAVYTSQIFKIQSFQSQVQDFLKKYYSGELYHQNLAPFSKPVSQVKQVNTKVLYNELKSKANTANQCIVEAYAPSCASCQFNGKVFNGFSRKLKKHGMLKDLPLYRMDSRNVSPIFGRFPYTPMYFLVKYEQIESEDNKRDVVIKAVDKISPIVKFNQFKQELMEKANLPSNFDERIKLNPQEQFQSYFMQKDLEQNYDPDFDYHKGQKSEDQYRVEKQKENQKEKEINKQNDNETVSQKEIKKFSD